MSKRLASNFLCVMFCAAFILLSGCDSEKFAAIDSYDDYTGYVDNEYSGDDEMWENESGRYVEPLTGATVTYPLSFDHSYEGSIFGGGMTFSMSDGSAQLVIRVDETFTASLDEHLENSMEHTQKVLAYQGNYAVIFDEPSFSASYYYNAYCLLDGGDLLNLNFSTERSDHAELFAEISVDFNGAVGELGLMGVHDISFGNVASIAKGIWRDDENGLWLYCPGGVLMSIFDDDSELLYCGYFDTFWKTAYVWNNNRYNVYINDDGGLDFIHKESFEFDNPVFVFSPTETLGLMPPATSGVPLEGVAAIKEVTYNPYRGQWVNDSLSCQIEIERDGLSIYESSNGGNYGVTMEYTIDDTGVLEMESLSESISATGRMYFNDDGSLMVEGYSGSFYPKGTNGASPYETYSGEWYNDEEGITLYLEDYGGLAYTMPDNTFGFSIWSIEGDGRFHILDEYAYIDDDGNMVIEGYKGLFKRQ